MGALHLVCWSKSCFFASCSSFCLIFSQKMRKSDAKKKKINKKGALKKVAKTANTGKLYGKYFPIPAYALFNATQINFISD